MAMAYKSYEHKIDGLPGQDIEVAQPFYFAEDAKGNPFPTNPSEVHAPPVRWTAYIFTPTDRRESMRHAMVLLPGEHGFPPPGVITEARFQLFGQAE